MSVLRVLREEAMERNKICISILCRVFRVWTIVVKSLVLDMFACASAQGREKKADVGEIKAVIDL